jgi:hypothetical protein
MRIPPNQVLFLGQRQWAEFDCSQEPLPDEIRILLWLMDGAERRHRLAIRWSGKEPRGTYPIVSFDDFALEPSNPEICGAQEFWPEAVLSAFERTFEAATQGALLLDREMIDIAQRHANASFGFLKRRDAGFTGYLLAQSIRRAHRASRGTPSDSDQGGG